MLFIRLWNYIRGYVIIKIKGEYGERLLNQAILQGIYIWEIKRLKKDILIAKINIHDFSRLRPLVRNSQCRVVIVERVGLFFYLNELMRRKYLMLGSIFFVLAMYLLSSFIWNIEINTVDNKLKSKIETDFQSWGLTKGTFKYKIDKKAYIDKILEKYSEIAWAEIQIKGSNLIVEIVKRQLPPELEENIPCDIIASKDGIIEKIVPLKGEAKVAKGDTISKGDILISGRVTIEPKVQEKNSENEALDCEKGKELLVSAKGLIKARVWYQKSIEVPLVKRERIDTGNQKKVYVLQVGNSIFNINSKDISFKNFDKEIEKQFNMLPNYLDNVCFTVLNYKEQKYNTEFLGVEGATKEVERKFQKYCDKNFKDNTIVSKKIDFDIDADKQVVIGSLTLEVIEDIGTKKRLN